MDILTIMLITTMAVTVGVWIVLITFLWLELSQLKKIRIELGDLPLKLTEAITFIEGAGSISNEMKESVLPTFLETASEVKIVKDDLKGSLDTLKEELKGKPAWFDLLITTLEARFEKKLKDELRILVSQK